MNIAATQLHQAVDRGDVAAARELLTQHPKIVDECVEGRGEMRVIHTALMQRDLPMMKLLLEFNADTEAGIWPNRDATNPIVMARDRGYDEILDAIDEARRAHGASGPRSPNEATRKLQAAYRLQDEDAMVAVFDQHPDLAEMCPPDGVTMLHQMAGHGAFKMMQWLIDRGADVNKKSQKGWTPLDFAIERGVRNLDQVADFLIDQGAHLSPRSAAALGRWDYLERCSKEDLAGKGVLEAAVKGNHPEVLRKLLDMGLDPDERVPVSFNAVYNEWSESGPLFEAVVSNRTEMAKLLLERGASPNKCVWCAGSPTYKAYEARNEEMIALVTRYGGWVDAGSAAYAGQTEIARKMLAGEIDPHLEPTDFSGKTVAEQLLWGGASSMTPEIVRMALEHVDWAPDDPRWFGMLWRPLPSADEEHAADGVECFRLILERCGPHHRGEAYKQTMLHEVMSRNADQRIANLLLDAGARMHVRDALLNSTPLGWACRWGRTELVKLLLARGADPIEANAEPWASPRAWAEKMNRPEIVALLSPTS